MKKRVIFGLAVFLFIPIVVNAAIIGGPETQGKGKFGIGVESECIFKRELKIKDHPFAQDAAEFIDEKSAKIEDMYRALAKIAYGVLDALDVYLKVGVARSAIDTKYTTGPSSNNHESGKLDFIEPGALAYGLGLKYKYDLSDDWSVGLDNQYMRHKNSFKAKQPFTLYNGAGAVTGIGYDSMCGRITTQEWQSALYIAKKINNFTPYVGGKYVYLRIDGKITTSLTTSMEFNTKHNFGLFAGLGYNLNSNIRLNIEGSYLDETAVGFGVNYRF
jgi:opacity protein-like surface antigen